VKLSPSVFLHESAWSDLATPDHCDLASLPAMRRPDALRPPNTITAVKAAHTAIWFTVETAVFYLLYAGIARKTGPSIKVAALVVAAESAIYVGNGARCPLTTSAESPGAEHGSVTDIYRPRWLARSLSVIHVPLLVLIVWLHTRPAPTV
jgi:hypothetical protein